MMQQVATKRSDVAALPIEVGHSEAPSTDGTGSAQFSAVLSDVDKQRQVNKASAPATQRDVVKTAPPAESNPDNTKAPAPASRHDKKNDLQATETDQSLTTETLTDEGSTTAQKASSDTTAQSQSEEIDWLAYVDNIRMLQDDAAGETALSPDQITFQLDGEQIEIGRLIDMPDTSIDPQQDKITPVPVAVGTLARELVKQVMGSAAGAEEQGGEDSSDDTARSSGDDGDLQALSAALLNAMNQAGGGGQSDADSQDFLQQLARLTQPEASEQTAVSQEDAGLLTALLSTEMQGEATVSNDGVDGAQDNLAAMLNGLTEQGQENMREAMASRVKELVGNVTSEAQQSKITEAVISGIKEMQAQLSQGHEPGFSVADLVAQSVADAGVDVDEQLQAGIHQQISQLSTIAQAASATTQAAASMLQPLGSDTMVVETNQLKSEAAQNGKTVDGADTAVNIQQPEGQKQLAEKIRWMVNSRNMMAEIRLDPPEMGSMQVRVNVQGDAASVSFIVQSPQAKDMLSQAEPRLRDMLAEQGIHLGESSVQQESQQSSQQQGEWAGSGHSGQQGSDGADEPVQVTEQQLTRRAQGGVDDYA